MRADSPAIVNYLCILKNCRRDWEEKTDDGTKGFQDLGATDQKKDRHWYEIAEKITRSGLCGKKA